MEPPRRVSTSSSTRSNFSISSRASTASGKMRSYDHVKSGLNTGNSVTAIMKKKEALNYVKKRGEIFKRIRTRTLDDILLDHRQVEISRENSQRTEQSREISSGKLTEGVPDSVAGTLEEPEIDDTDRDYSFEEKYQPPYLLLDVRTEEEFDQSFIYSSKHYPATMLSRSTNEFIPEILAYKNKKGTRIIVYDFEETIAPHVATVMFQKGIDNVFLLSGGLYDMNEKFSRWVIGTPPEKKVPRTTPSRASRRSHTRGL